MINGDIYPGMHVMHIRTSRHYVVLKKTSMKIGDTENGEWVPGINYADPFDSARDFTREEHYFRAYFQTDD